MPDLTLASGRTLYGRHDITANAAAIRSYGYSRAEFMGLTAEARCARAYLFGAALPAAEVA